MSDQSSSTKAADQSHGNSVSQIRPALAMKSPLAMRRSSIYNYSKRMSMQLKQCLDPRMRVWGYRRTIGTFGCVAKNQRIHRLDTPQHIRSHELSEWNNPPSPSTRCVIQGQCQGNTRRRLTHQGRVHAKRLAHAVVQQLHLPQVFPRKGCVGVVTEYRLLLLQ